MTAIQPDLIAHCPTVESTVNYLDEMDELPVFYAHKVDNNLKLSTHSDPGARRATRAVAPVTRSRRLSAR